MSADPQPLTQRRGRGTTLVAATAAAAALAAGLLPGASAQSSTARILSLHELNKGSTLTHVRNTPTKAKQANLQGDLIVFTNPLTDAGGAKVGKLNVQCVTTTGAQHFEKSTITCVAVLHLRDGDLMAQLDTHPGAPTSTGAITGGTGAYASARGLFVSKATKAGSDDSVTLAG